MLHDTLDLAFADVADVLACSVDAARQHASRGRRRLHAARAEGLLPAPRPPADQAWKVVGDLLAALQDGDALRMAALLAPDVVFVSDGAGMVSAATRPLHGADGVSRFLRGLVSKYPAVGYTVEPVLVNGDPGVLLRLGSDNRRHPKLAVYAFTVQGGVVRAVHAVLAPDKLRPAQRRLALTPAIRGQIAGLTGAETLRGEPERPVEP